MANNDSANSADMSRNRRSSFSSTTFSSLFPRSNSISSGTPVFPGPIASAAMNENRRRRLSISTTAALGLSGGSPISSGGPNSAGIGAGGLRRASLSTNSSTSETAVDESAIEEDDAPPSGSRVSPHNAPFARRTSFGAQAMRSLRGSGGPGVAGSSNDQGYNWPEHFRSRAESSVSSGPRPSFSSYVTGRGNSPPRAGGGFSSVSGMGGGGVGSGVRHDRSRSVSDVPPPVPPPAPRQRQHPHQHPQPRAKPDHFQERILKGDFYMD